MQPHIVSTRITKKIWDRRILVINKNQDFAKSPKQLPPDAMLRST